MHSYLILLFCIVIALLNARVDSRPYASNVKLRNQLLADQLEFIEYQEENNLELIKNLRDDFSDSIYDYIDDYDKSFEYSLEDNYALYDDYDSFFVNV